MTETISAAVATDSGLSCLAIVSRFFGRPLDPEQLRHEFASPSAAAAAAVILRAAKRSELKARRVRGESALEQVSAARDDAISRRFGTILLEASGRTTALTGAAIGHARRPSSGEILMCGAAAIRRQDGPSEDSASAPSDRRR